jgi:hypothetical protein
MLGTATHVFFDSTKKLDDPHYFSILRKNWMILTIFRFYEKIEMLFL